MSARWRRYLPSCSRRTNLEACDEEPEVSTHMERRAGSFNAHGEEGRKSGLEVLRHRFRSKLLRLDVRHSFVDRHVVRETIL